jgi:PilZ domain-containing protein
MADTDVEVRVSKPFDRRDTSIRSPAAAHSPDAPDGSKSADPADRRRHPRYRFSEPMKVCCQDGACLDGISVELSQSGMSAMIQGPLKPGDVVRLQPVTGVITAAVVRHKLGMLYGFEFLELALEQAGKIADRCRRCEPWRSNARAV